MTVHSLTLQPRETGTATGKETDRQTGRVAVGQTTRRFIELAKQCLASKPKLASKIVNTLVILVSHVQWGLATTHR